MASPLNPRLLSRAVNAAGPEAPRLYSSNSRTEAAFDPLVKAFLERQGYVVRGEGRGCELVARRADEAPVIVKLEAAFHPPVLLQGIDHLTLSLQVYLAVPRQRREREACGRTRSRCANYVVAWAWA